MCFIWKQDIPNSIVSIWNDLLSSSQFAMRQMCVQHVKTVSTGTSHCWWCSASTCSKYMELHCSPHNGEFLAYFISTLSLCQLCVPFIDMAYEEKWPTLIHEISKCQQHVEPWHSNNNRWLKYKSPYWQLSGLELGAIMCFKCRDQVSQSPYTLKHLDLCVF